MIKFLKHIPLFLLGALIIFLMTAVRFDDYPLVHYVDLLVWPLAVLLLLLLCVYKWRHKACFILGILFLSPAVLAGGNSAAICSYYNAYSNRIEAYAKDYFKQDEECDASILQMARDEARQYKLSPNENVGDISALIMGWEKGSCALDLMTICSEYDRRNPKPVVQTYDTLSNQGVGTTPVGMPSTSCWPCDIVYVVFTVIQELSSNLADMMSYVALKILLWGAVFWLLFKAAGMVLTSKGGVFFSQIAGGLLAIMVAAFILNHPQGLSTLYSGFLSPVMRIGLHISDKIQSSAGIDRYGVSTSGQPSFSRQVEMQQNTSFISALNRIQFADYCSYISESSSSPTAAWLNSFIQNIFPNISTDFRLSLSSEGKTLLTDDLKAQLLCMTQKFYYQSKPFIIAGQSLISFSVHHSQTIKQSIVSFFSPTKFPSNLCMWFVGACLVVLFTWFSFLVAFRIIDIFLKLGFVLVLMPIFIVSAVFPITRSYTLKAWNFLFQTIVEFIGLAVAASFAMLMLESAIAPNSERLLQAINAPNSSQYGENLLRAITADMTFVSLFTLAATIFMSAILMKSFPIMVAFLFNVTDSSDKGKAGTITGGALANIKGNVQGWYGSAKGVAQTAAGNPYKTKEEKAKAAEKDLKDKQRKLNEEKRKPNNQKNIEKAQKEVDQAKIRADAFRADADRERQITASSTSGYVARRFGDNTGNAIRKGGSATASGIEKFSSKVGGVLMKNGVTGLVGVPVVLAGKVASAGVRATAKTFELGAKGLGRVGEGAHRLGRKILGRPPLP